MTDVLPWWRDRAHLLEVAAKLRGDGGRSATRTADLILGRALAGRLGLLEAKLEPRHLERELSEAALFPLPSLSDDEAVRDQAIGAALRCADHLEDGASFHLWSESSQAADPGRKGRGAFSTPPALADVMVAGALAGHDRDAEPPAVLDPSVGHGALLLPLVSALLARGCAPRDVLRSLHGVELDPYARELCCLLLWLKLADPEVALGSIASRIVVANALTARWRHKPTQAGLLEEDAARTTTAFVWEDAFADVFARDGFDVVLANPPWESLRTLRSTDLDEWQERELTRAQLSEQMLTGRKLPPLFSAQGSGDRNLFKAFVELFPHLLRSGGSLFALLPGAFSSDFGMKDAREFYLEHMSMERWTGFENLAGYFPIDSRYKFGLLVARRDPRGTRRLRVRSMARHAREASSEHKHLSLSRLQIAKIGGSTNMLPEVADRRELMILERAFDRGSPFFEKSAFGMIEYRRELDLTLDRKAGKFVYLAEARADGFESSSDGSWTDGSTRLVPLIEGRMVTSWDFYEKSWISGSGRTAVWRTNDGPVCDCQPQFLAEPLEESACRLAICDVTSATNTRTMRATWVPAWPCGNTAPVLVTQAARGMLALAAVLNSMTFDWLLRRLASGLHLNRFYLDAMRLPVVDEGELSELARFAAATLLEGRAGSLPAAETEELPKARAGGPAVHAARVEAIVAKGYGLESSDLRRMLDPEVTDRKGLWRYFAAVPQAEQVATESVQLLEAA
jgi:hypothetical protein